MRFPLLALGGVLLALAGASPAAAQHHFDGPPAGDLPGATDENGQPVTDPGLTPDQQIELLDPPAATPAPVGPTDPTGLVPAPPAAPVLPTVTTATVPGRVAMLRTDGRAAIPRGAPKRIRALIAAANAIVGKPYKWGGGHTQLIDRGYDCSGSVSYALIGASLLPSVQVSGTLAHWATPGAGRWLSVYANSGHVYLEVAGLRFDTSPVGDPTGRSGVRWRPLIGARPRFAIRHVLGL